MGHAQTSWLRGRQRSALIAAKPALLPRELELPAQIMADRVGEDPVVL